MGRAGGRAGEGVSPLHAASGFNGLQQNPITPTGGSMAKQSSFGTPASSGNQNPLQMAYEQNNSNLQNINDLHSLFPQLSSTNSVNELLMQYRKAQHEQQQSAQAQAQANAFQQSGANTAHLQAQLLGVARNGQFAEQLSQMQAMLMQQAQHNNFDGVQAAAQRLGSGTHPLQVSFDLASQQQNMLGSPATRPVPSFQTEALPAQNTQDLFLSSHQHVSALQNPPTRSNNPAFSFGNGADVARSAHHQQQQHQRQQQQQQELAAESSGVESADEGAAAAGKGDRKEARKEYHKRIERKRRDRMRNLYDELRSLVNPDEPADKNSVLAGAVSLIQELRDENIKLQSRVHIKEKVPSLPPLLSLVVTPLPAPLPPMFAIVPLMFVQCEHSAIDSLSFSLPRAHTRIVCDFFFGLNSRTPPTRPFFFFFFCRGSIY